MKVQDFFTTFNQQKNLLKKNLKTVTTTCSLDKTCFEKGSSFKDCPLLKKQFQAVGVKSLMTSISPRWSRPILQKRWVRSRRLKRMAQRNSSRSGWSKSKWSWNFSLVLRRDICPWSAYNMATQQNALNNLHIHYGPPCSSNDPCTPQNQRHMICVHYRIKSTAIHF